MATDMKKPIFSPSQRYDVPPDRVEKRFVSTITLELDGIRNRKWNAERAIIFQTVILQRVRLVTGAKNIRDRINSHLDSWNKGTYKKLVQDSYSAAPYYLGKSHKTKNGEQCHLNFLSIIIRRKLCEAVRFICDRETGGVLLPSYWATEKAGITDETVVEVLAGKHPPES